MSKMEITYLQHSGFAVTTDKHVLIFDYYQDPANQASELTKVGKTTYVFSSHGHSDHFAPAIGMWQQQVTTYILSDDIKSMGGLPSVPAEKIRYMAPCEKLEQGELTVTTYGSTDAGVSFAVEIDGWRIFHAGDLNWWHWKGDTADNLRLAEEGFRNELARLAGQSFDVAFFPVDNRLEECRAMGVTEFCRTVDIKQLVVMHTCGRAWTAPEGFPGQGNKVAVWCPTAGGEVLNVTKE